MTDVANDLILPEPEELSECIDAQRQPLSLSLLGFAMERACTSHGPNLLVMSPHLWHQLASKCRADEFVTNHAGHITVRFRGADIVPSILVRDDRVYVFTDKKCNCVIYNVGSY